MTTPALGLLLLGSTIAVHAEEARDIPKTEVTRLLHDVATAIQRRTGITPDIRKFEYAAACETTEQCRQAIAAWTNADRIVYLRLIRVPTRTRVLAELTSRGNEVLSRVQVDVSRRGNASSSLDTLAATLFPSNAPGPQIAQAETPNGTPEIPRPGSKPTGAIASTGTIRKPSPPIASAGTAAAVPEVRPSSADSPRAQPGSSGSRSVAGSVRRSDATPAQKRSDYRLTTGQNDKPPIDPSVSTEVAKPDHGRRLWPWWIIGGSVAAGGAAVALGMHNSSLREEGMQPGLDRAHVESLQDETFRTALGANILFGVAITGLVTGTILLIAD